MYNRWMPPEYSTELYHHGIKGMKWGVRRYQPYPDGSYGAGGKAIQKAERIAGKGTARAYAKSLNRLAVINGESKSKRAEYTERYNDLVTKHHKYRDAGNEKKAAKFESKAWKMRAKLGVEDANAQVSAAKWKRIGEEAVKQGYDVKLTRSYMYSKKANQDAIVAQMYLGLVGNIAITAANTKADKEFRKKYGTDYSPYAYDMQYARVKKQKS